MQIRLFWGLYLFGSQAFVLKPLGVKLKLFSRSGCFFVFFFLALRCSALRSGLGHQVPLHGVWGLRFRV